MTKESKVLSLLGLATKAGKVASGEYVVENKVKSNEAYLVIVACDASENTKKSYNDMCTYYKVPIVYFGNKDSLGKCIGKEFRASICILDAGFSKEIIKKINEL